VRVVIALGGNALLRRGEPLTAENQRDNVRRAARSIATVLEHGHQAVITHGNGPQVGLLALQSHAYKPSEVFPLDVLGAETEGMIGYLIEQELENAYAADAGYATLLTQIEVDPNDLAFTNPTKPVGPVFNKAEADRLAVERGWTMAPDGASFRRVVPSPTPLRIIEIGVIRRLVDQGVIVICAGGGGIPVVRCVDGMLFGVEGVIDKDRASGLLARELGADALVMLTDVDGVYNNWGTPEKQLIRAASPAQLRDREFAAGSMGPKVEAACDFVEATGGMAGIGALDDAIHILNGSTGTVIRRD